MNQIPVERTPRSNLGPPRGVAARLTLALAPLLILAFLIWNSARAGYAALLTAKAASTNNLAAANTAVSLSPGNPDAHLMLGALLEVHHDRPAAIVHYQTAIALRPEDYVLWLQLARAQELEGDSAAAISSGQNAVSLAPFYAQPHWQLGNTLVRAGRLENGFSELRLAGASDPTLLGAIIDLAWQLSDGKVEYVIEAVQPHTPETYKALTEYFRTRGQVAEAIAMFGSAGNEAEVLRAREQYLNELISAKRFKDAYELWSLGRGLSSNAFGAIVDPGFEQESNLDEPGFGWRTANKAQTVTLALDTANPKEGKSSLRVEFTGDSDPAASIISQLVLVEPNNRYQLHFAARTESIVSGGLPLIGVTDASTKEPLGTNITLTQPTSNWQDYTLDFNTNSATTAIQINLQRQNCSNSPCPIFGRLWLDDFSLRKL